MNRVIRAALLFYAMIFTGCAGSAPRIYEFDDMEVYTAPFDEVWSIVGEISRSRKWRIEESERSNNRAFIVTDWMADRENGGDFGNVGISLGQANKPLNDKTRQVAINIRVVSESLSVTRVKVTCLFRIQTSQSLSGTGQTRFGTSKGVVEQQLLTTIRSRLAAS